MSILIENPLQLCLHTNKPGESERLRMWASTSTGRALGRATACTILDELTPVDFVLHVFALLSYYRNRHDTDIFIPIKQCDNYVSAITEFNAIDDEANGRVLERVAFSVIHACRCLLPEMLRIPYLRPYQLDIGMEYSKSTAALDMYSYIRISQTCSHEDAVSRIRVLFGATTNVVAPNDETEFEDINRNDLDPFVGSKVSFGAGGGAFNDWSLIDSSLDM
ncbi:hypothetical protein F5Y16DRAFT_419628 [Xylariaceae sp. FL0255]|nr:hypothetical protein F5Y16DRAFT_419628 [Xylariaceae sp. FL0255]